MVCSMTAFARSAYDGDTGRYTWEIRSVNHRYTEVFIRMPEDVRALETELREQLSKCIKRGKLDCNLRVESDTAVTDLAINEDLARSVLEALARLEAISPGRMAHDALEILRWPGVLEAHKADPELVAREVRSAFDDTLRQLIDTRRREGAKLKTMVLERCDGITAQITQLRNRVPEIITAMTDRYVQRINDYAGDLDKARIEQECALLMQKLDIAEELDRLEAHLDEVRRVLRNGSPAGRRLDFLMQELNREANTIGSKSAHIDSSTASVELKVLIEQMREQIQNIE